jgi:hypothetical protein
MGCGVNTRVGFGLPRPAHGRPLLAWQQRPDDQHGPHEYEAVRERAGAYSTQPTRLGAAICRSATAPVLGSNA